MLIRGDFGLSPVDYHEMWLSQPIHQLQSESTRLRTQLSTLQQRYFRRELTRSQYFEQYQSTAIHLEQLQALLRVKS